ncbi:CLUMA_CG014727, isoform A [Clunio marinus]|uniref:CLUMA_CG014727, isoform A n=1 Tax=Clunio marinus TaxID=568069 RepID=A0A1J1IN10_9DIPT|nr:CLUMA_CG014727, isoform A [Clunio marinus]
MLTQKTENPFVVKIEIYHNISNLQQMYGLLNKHDVSGKMIQLVLKKFDIKGFVNVKCVKANVEKLQEESFSISEGFPLFVDSANLQEVSLNSINSQTDFLLPSIDMQNF